MATLTRARSRAPLAEGKISPVRAINAAGEMRFALIMSDGAPLRPGGRPSTFRLDISDTEALRLADHIARKLADSGRLAAKAQEMRERFSVLQGSGETLESWLRRHRYDDEEA